MTLVDDHLPQDAVLTQDAVAPLVRRRAVRPAGAPSSPGVPAAPELPPAFRLRQEGAGRSVQQSESARVVDTTGAVTAPERKLAPAVQLVPEASTPQDVLTLREYTDPAGRLPENLSAVRDYGWHQAEDFEKADRWARGLLAAQAAGMPIDFFVDALFDIYHYDRAFRGHHRNQTAHAPLRETDVPQEIRQSSGTYVLQRRPFAWTPQTPHDATDAVSAFVQRTPPDKFWIADYVRQVPYPSYPYHYDPIIYAQFGTWVVEVARWD